MSLQKKKPVTLPEKAAFVRAEYLMTGVVDEIEQEIEVIKGRNPNNNFIQKKDNQVAKIVQYSVAADELIKAMEHIIKLQDLQLKVMQDLITHQAKTDETFEQYFLKTFSHLQTTKPAA